MEIYWGMKEIKFKEFNFKQRIPVFGLLGTHTNIHKHTQNKRVVSM